MFDVLASLGSKLFGLHHEASEAEKDRRFKDPDYADRQDKKSSTPKRYRYKDGWGTSSLYMLITEGESMGYACDEDGALLHDQHGMTVYGAPQNIISHLVRFGELGNYSDRND
jgi:hypothetical protein